LKIFGFFFIILIGFVLIETIEMYFKENVIHAEVILLVAVIAVSRKVILLDLDKYDPLAIIGLGLIIVALGACYALIKFCYRGKNA
ncbi:phosphate-starvation-inducible PsiE family protein, partial [Shewanella sp. Isolate13]|uniref:phosphate-starvation-inducible PsiE family protein n=1 Tax=Shewanella sp. Isolate13 TaxID=2908531 RepID=UPI001EFCB25F